MIKSLVLLAVACAAQSPPAPIVLPAPRVLPAPLPAAVTPDDGLDHLRQHRPTGEYAAPIPDSLASTHELTRDDGSTFSIVLEIPKPEETLTRLNGPRHPYPHQGCLMCLGNHMISSHGQSTIYLHSITYDQWKILHDNLHNGKDFVGVRGSGEGYIGYEAGGGGSVRRGLFRRRR